MITFPAVDSANSIVVDTNVIMNLLISDPTGSSLDLLILDNSTTYITDTVEAELRNNLTGEKFAAYLQWAYRNHAAGEVLLVATGIPTGGNQGEASMLWAVENGFAGSGPYLMLSGDGDARESFGGLDTANTMEYANSLLLSGEITLLRYYALTAQIAVVAPHEVIGADGANFAFIPGMRVAVNGVIVVVGKTSISVNGQEVGLLQTFEIDPETGAVTIDGPKNCFSAGTIIDMWPTGSNAVPKDDGLYDKAALLAKVWQKPIEEITPDDIVLSYDKLGNLIPGKVSRTFQNNVQHLLDVHGLKVTPGHVTLCGDGKYAGRHVPIIDILLSDGALVRENGDLIRMSINKPVGSVEDQMVQVLWAETAEDIQAGNLQTGKMRVGTLLFDRDGEPVSVLDCLQAEGLAFDPETGLVNHPGQAPAALHWFGRLPCPEDYILRRSRETLDGILTDGEWEAMPSALIAEKLRMTRQMQTH